MVVADLHKISRVDHIPMDSRIAHVCTLDPLSVVNSLAARLNVRVYVMNE